MGQALSTVGQFLPGIMAAKTAFSGPQAGATKQLANVNDALINNQNPLYQQLYGQNKQNNLNSLSQAMAEYERQNRNLAANGRVPLFAQGRQGEQIFRAMAQQYQGNDQQAAAQTLAQLQAGAGGLSKQVLPAQVDQENNKLGGYQDIALLLKRLGGQQQPNKNSPQPEADYSSQLKAPSLQLPSLTAPSNIYGAAYDPSWKSYSG